MKVHANGIDIHYEVAGSGPWLTLSHSLACDLSMWEPQLEAFCRHFTVLRYDTRGHGQSSAPEGAYSLALLRDDAFALLDALKIERTHFLGLSMGGMIAQHVALTQPQRLASLILAATSSRTPAAALPLWQERLSLVREKGTAALVDSTLERWFTAPYRVAHPEVMARIAALIVNTPAAGYLGCGQAIPTLDLTDRLREVTAPTLVLAGAEDAATSPAVARDIVAAIPGARLEVIAGAAHLVNIEQAGRFNQLVLAFLGSRKGAGS